MVIILGVIDDDRVVGDIKVVDGTDNDDASCSVEKRTTTTNKR